MNLVFVIVDSLRYDKAEKHGLFEAMKPSSIFKCRVLGETTTISLPQILTGLENPGSETVGWKQTENGVMWLTKINEKTIFDYFKQKGFFTQYINLDREDDFYEGNRPSFFPSLPSGLSFGKSQLFEPHCLVIHCWGVHYPHPKGYDFYVNQWVRERVPTLMKLQDTLVVLMADHGEMLGEEDRWGHKPPMTRELQEVPLVIYPTSEHKTHDTVVESTQILPTVLDMFEIKHKLKGSLLTKEEP